jgi:hypothetical protein
VSPGHVQHPRTLKGGGDRTAHGLGDEPGAVGEPNRDPARRARGINEAVANHAR